MHQTSLDNESQYFVVDRIAKIDDQQLANIKLRCTNTNEAEKTIIVPCGSGEVLQDPGARNLKNYVLTSTLEQHFGSMVQHHETRDLLLVAPTGEGKSATANYFGQRIGYSTRRVIHLYPEMTARDLLLRRSTCPITGQTTWEDSELVESAKAGDLCILDGIEKLRPNVLASLSSLCVDRDVYLPDGRRMWEQGPSLTDQYDDGGVISIHPSFRIIALASPSANNSSDANFLDEAMNLFATIFIDHSESGESRDIGTRAILESIKNPDCPEEALDKLLLLRRRLTGEVSEDCGVAPLSTRNLIRVVQKIHNSQDDLATVLLQSIFVADLLPPSQRASLERILHDCGIEKTGASPPRNFLAKESSKQDELDVKLSDEFCSIGGFSLPRKKVTRLEMVPSPKFFDIPYHIAIIKGLLMDWNRGERAFLMLGNQGVGKNMIIDRLCQLARFEREYIQLHRDSTVGQITLQPTLENGKVMWKDSPLLRAVRDGLTLVVDEADKAPTEVLSVLKGLVEDGELLLGDGRRISRHSYSSSENIIPIHPDFSLWILANRPGFPFLGNAFFQLIGDCFSTRVIANPDLESEIGLLEQYGPSVEPRILRRIAASFSELRHLSDIGDIAYPYSTRESVAVVKHLQAYPDDGVVTALHNVFDFDSYEETIYATLANVFQQHDIPVQSYTRWQKALESQGNSLQIEIIGDRPAEGTSSTPPPLRDPKRGKWDAENQPHIGGNQWAGGTGGSDTAGLGGRGGPYRLDRGHKAHQISEEDKAKVSKETAQKARKISQQALKEKLQEISMSPGDWSMYKQFTDPIRRDVVKLRSILNQIEISQKERGWIKQQSHGELDDSKIVDSVVGERYIYKRRGILEESSMTFSSPKRLYFVVDVSASMYRFNGHDERLTRELEVTNLLMESFEGMDQRFDYSIVGHSGDSPAIPLVDFGRPPVNEKERMQVLQTMLAHTQYCQSGDHTLAAIGRAINGVKVRGNDNNTSLVIALSDANLERYGIHPRSLGKIMKAGDAKQVKSHCIFLASFGPEAEEIRRDLPPGRGHICTSTKDLPRLVRDILTSNA